jgi:hypothetical protein
MSVMGQQRRFERASGMSAIAPIATEPLHCSNRRKGANLCHYAVQQKTLFA